VTKKPSLGSAPTEEPPRHPWRDNIEAITMAIIMAVLLKYFVVEAYKIPTGSMQPTLMGLTMDADDGVFDRILVDKLSYHFRDPERFEVAVFKYPLDRSKNFIKRIWGMPSEELRIRDGDIFRRDLSDPESRAPALEWEPVRRPKPIQREMLKRLETTDEWRIETAAGGWSFGDDSLTASGPGRASYPKSKSTIRDYYTDGYPPELAKRVRRRGRGEGTNNVGDLRVQGDLRANDDCTWFTVTLKEGTRAYDMRFPGPAAGADARPTIHIHDTGGELEDRTVTADSAWQLQAGDSVSFAAQNLDNLLELEIDGDILIEVEIPVAVDQRSRISLALEGGGGDLDALEVFRDVFYTVQHATTTHWKIPAESYVMLGDNTQDSADGREWQLAGMRKTAGPDAGNIIRGNRRGNENPQRVTGGPNGGEVFFRDLYGERHNFLESEAETLTPEKTPFVPRSLMTGRALLVFWPIKPSLDVYRLQWVH
jgi:signal peptidase I